MKISDIFAAEHPQNLASTKVIINKKTAKKGLDILKEEIQKLIQIELDKRQREESTEAAVENEPELKRYGNHIYKTGYKREYCQMILRHAEEGKE